MSIAQILPSGIHTFKSYSEMVIHHVHCLVTVRVIKFSHDSRLNHIFFMDNSLAIRSSRLICHLLSFLLLITISSNIDRNGSTKPTTLVLFRFRGKRVLGWHGSLSPVVRGGASIRGFGNCYAYSIDSERVCNWTHIGIFWNRRYHSKHQVFMVVLRSHDIKER